MEKTTTKCSVCGKECDLHRCIYSYTENGMTKMFSACSKECHKKFANDLQTRIMMKEMNEIANELI